MGDPISELLGSIGAGIGYAASGDDRQKMLDYLNQNLAGFQGISQDQNIRAAQMKALGQMGNMSSMGGLDPQSQAAYAEAQQKAAGFEQAQRGANEQRLAARGMGGSGAEIASLVGSQQAGANSAAMGGLQAAADARSRALQALSNYGSYAQGIGNQDFNQKMSREEAIAKARGGLQNYYASDQAAKVGIGQGIGQGIGGVGDFAVKAATNPMSLMSTGGGPSGNMSYGAKDYKIGDMNSEDLAKLYRGANG